MTNSFILTQYKKCPRIAKCYELDQRCLFSIANRARKFSDGLNITLPVGYKEKPVLKQAQVAGQAMKEVLWSERLKEFMAKPQHGAFFRQLDVAGIKKKAALMWLDKCHFSPQSEAYVTAAQELAIFTRWHEKHLLKTAASDLCRLCKKQVETTSHILGGCDVLAKKEYFDRHNSVAKYIHFEICKNYAFIKTKKWHCHKPDEVVLNRCVEVLYDTVIATDREIGANRPDIVIRDKVEKKTYILDVSCPIDVNVIKKEQEKVSKYSGLRAELGRMWGCECVVVPVVVGGLGTVSDDFERFVKMIPGGVSWMMCIKIALLGSEKIMRTFLSRGRTNVNHGWTGIVL